MTTTGRLILSALVLQFLFVLGGCKKSSLSNAGSQAQPSSSPISNLAGAPRLDACSLLTKEEVAEVQGSPITQTNSSTDAQGPFVVSQCYFAAAETNKSVSLAVTQANPDSSDKQSVDGYWNETFGRFRDGKDEAKEEEEKAHPPRKIEEIGAEAYWSTNLVSASLYFLKNGTVVRLSLGGPDDEEKKISKSKTLAQKIITRM